MNKKTYFSWKDNNLLLEIQVQTKASKDAIMGEYNHRLKIAITTAPIEGKANDHLIRFLAKYFAVPKSHVTITKGHASKYKLILITKPKNSLDKFKN